MEGTIALKFIVFFKSLINSIIVNYSINYLLGVIIGLSSYSIYSKLIFFFYVNVCLYPLALSIIKLKLTSPLLLSGSI